MQIKKAFFTALAVLLITNTSGHASTGTSAPKRRAKDDSVLLKPLSRRRTEKAQRQKNLEMTNKGSLIRVTTPQDIFDAYKNDPQRSGEKTLYELRMILENNGMPLPEEHFVHPRYKDSVLCSLRQNALSFDEKEKLDTQRDIEFIERHFKKTTAAEKRALIVSLLSIGTYSLLGYLMYSMFKGGHDKKILVDIAATLAAQQKTTPITEKEIIEVLHTAKITPRQELITALLFFAQHGFNLIQTTIVPTNASYQYVKTTAGALVKVEIPSSASYTCRYEFLPEKIGAAGTAAIQQALHALEQEWSLGAKIKRLWRKIKN